MVEPVAAVVFNSLLSSRASITHPPSINLAVWATGRPNRPALPADFFLPTPRRVSVKGKERARGAADNECGVGHLEQCQDWSCAWRHSIWCPKRHRALMLNEFASPRRDRLPRPIPSRPSPSHVPARPLRAQKRHVSHLSELPNTAGGAQSGDDPEIFHGLPPSADMPGLSHKHGASPESSAGPPNSGPSSAARQLMLQKFRFMTRDAVGRFNLQEAWGTYNSVIELGVLDLLHLAEILSFADKFVAVAESNFDSNVDVDAVPEWGRRANCILESIKDRYRHRSFFDNWQQTLTARSTILTGDLDKAKSLVHSLVGGRFMLFRDEGTFLHGYERLILGMKRHHGVSRVLEFLLAEWTHVGAHLTEASKQHLKAMSLRSKSFRNVTFAILESIPDPAALLARHSDRSDEQRRRLGEMLVAALCERDLADEAHAVYQEMRRQSLTTSYPLRLALVRSLTRADAFEFAEAVFASIPRDSFVYYLSTGLYLFSHKGDFAKAEYYYDLLGLKASRADMAQFMYAYATEGKIEEVTALFERLFPRGGPGGERMNFPNAIDYSIVIYGHAQRGDFDGMNFWLDAMVKQGITPTSYVFNNILKSFAMRGDMDSIAVVLDQMRSAGVQPNLVSYTIVITLLAHRKDPVGAESIYRRAMREGVVPDRRMISSLMNAHVEAGSWQGVIRAFDYIRSSPARNVRLTIEVYNTLLKAYVLIGAPFRVVSRLFGKLESAKVRPDAYTFATLVQSACDAGYMDMASDIFAKMERLSEQPESTIRINAYVLTIIMAGHLRLGDKVRAKAVYDEMRERGIQPTSITFGSILKAYGNERTEESLRTAEAFINSLVHIDSKERVWIRPTHGRKSALDHVYGPLMYAYAKQQRPEDVERLYQDMLDVGGEPSLGVLTTLLDAYRRTFNIDGVVQIWPQIFELGLRYTRVGPLFDGESDDPSRPRLQANILCLPLSVYVDALSVAGRHLDIAAAWREFQAHGFAFDSNNWNHLLVALVRAGEPERAFDVLEKVILPYQRRTEVVLSKRDVIPSTPLSFTPVPRGAPEAPTPTRLDEPPMHRIKRRAQVVRRATLVVGDTVDFADEVNREDDFARPLHILHQISPSWNVWKPHAVSLKMLLLVMVRLRSGSIIRPVKPDDGDQLHNPEVTEESQAAEAAAARDILSRIYQNCPQASQVILQHEVTEKRRLRGRYHSVYTWT